MKPWPLVRQLGELLHITAPSFEEGKGLHPSHGALSLLCKDKVRLGVNSWFPRLSADPTITNFSITLTSNIFHPV